MKESEVEDFKSRKEAREAANSKAVGGLRHAKKAVERSWKLPKVGQRLRKVVDPFLASEVVRKLEHDIPGGFSETWLQQVKEAMAAEFGVAASLQGGFQVALWSKLLVEADDVEKK